MSLGNLRGRPGTSISRDCFRVMQLSMLCPIGGGGGGGRAGGGGVVGGIIERTPDARKV